MSGAINPSAYISRPGVMKKSQGRPSKACNVCKRQKIRCSADRPSCRRCVRLKNSCHYDNHGVQKQVTSAERRKALLSSLSEPLTATSHSSVDTRTVTLKAPDDNVYPEIPASLVNILVELYFDNVYQSDLLLHKPTFLQSLANSSVRPHVLLSICAWGANFYRDADGKATLKDDELMTRWAKKAGALVFQDVEDLHEDNIVTFCNLSLFWHSQGSWRISYLHKGNACQFLHIIGTGSNRSSTLESEIFRRRFWACYLMHCFSSEKLFRFEAIADVQHLPLPWPENNFESGIPPSDVATITNGVNTGSIFSDLIRGLHLWSCLAPIVRSKGIGLGSRLQQIFSVESDILAWWSKVSSSFKLDTSTSLSMDHKSLSKVFLINLVYHQSLCALHSSIVPLFCWSKGDSSQSSARQFSAQIAFEHAGAISTLTTAVLSSSCSPSGLPIFVAYAAYSSCAIQIPFFWCSEPTVKAQAKSNVERNMKMIQEMSSYWKLASLLQIYARCIHDVHKRDPPRLSNEPKYADFSAFLEFGAGLSLAKASILEFTGILRSGESGFVKPGEESRDLIARKTTVTPSAQRSFEGNGSLNQSSGDIQPDFSAIAALDSQFPSFSGTESSEWSTFDMFNSLLDADMTSLFPLDDNIDLSGFDIDFLAWDIPDST